MDVAFPGTCFLSQVHLELLPTGAWGGMSGRARPAIGVVPSYLSGHQLAPWGELSHSKTPVFAPSPSLAPRTGRGDPDWAGH